MTTKAPTENPCLGERCEHANRRGHQCGRLRFTHGVPLDSDTQGSAPDHHFVPHEHVEMECSARFWEQFAGCTLDEINGVDGPLLLCVGDAEHWRAKHQNVAYLPDIIYAPETDEARLAMFVVLEEAGKRDWFVDIDVAPTGCSVRIAINRADDSSGWVDGTGAGELPRAVALAALGALHASQQEGLDVPASYEAHDKDNSS